MTDPRAPDPQLPEAPPACEGIGWRTWLALIGAGAAAWAVLIGAVVAVALVVG